MSTSDWENLFQDFSFEKLQDIFTIYYKIFKVVVRRGTENHIHNLDYIDIIVIWTVILIVSLYVLRKLKKLFSEESRADFKHNAMKCVKRLPIIK